jgi:hypothetical protein
MNQYLLSIHSGAAPDGDQTPQTPPSPEQMQAMMQGIISLEADMGASGTFLFGGHLHGVDAAPVVAPGEGNHMLTDGPYAEAKEHVAGFYIINAEDLDAALVWAKKVVDAVGAPIEVRPFAATGKAADNMPPS